MYWCIGSLGSQVDKARGSSCECGLGGRGHLSSRNMVTRLRLQDTGVSPTPSFPCQLGSGGGWGRSLSYNFLSLGAGLFGSHCSLAQRGSDKLVVCGFWCQQEKLPPSFSLHPEVADAARPLDTTGPTEEGLRLYLSHKGVLMGCGQAQEAEDNARIALGWHRLSGL